MGLVKKLLLKPGYRAAVINGPNGFQLAREELADGQDVTTGLNGEFDFVLLFAENQSELNRFVPDVLNHLKEEALFWVAYPKKSSKIKSDITRDSGWETLKDFGFVGVSLISIDDTWSAFRVRHEKYIKSLNK